MRGCRIGSSECRRAGRRGRSGARFRRRPPDPNDSASARFQMRRPRTLRCDHVENIADRLRVASGFAEILPRLPRTFLTFLISAGTSADTFEYFGGQLALVEMQCFADWRIRHQRCSCRFTDCCAADDCVADSRPATSCAIIAVKSSCCPSCDCLRNAATSITCASA